MFCNHPKALVFNKGQRNHNTYVRLGLFQGQSAESETKSLPIHENTTGALQSRIVY